MVGDLRTWLRLELKCVAGLKLACDFGEKCVSMRVSRFWGGQFERGSQLRSTQIDNAVKRWSFYGVSRGGIPYSLSSAKPEDRLKCPASAQPLLEPKRKATHKIS